jgi:hypothetical protein
MDDFPIDDSFTIVFPCFMVRSEDDQAFACHAVTGGGHLVVVLTDEDSLNEYRHGIGYPERGAVRFRTPQQLHETLLKLPPEVTHVAFDLQRLDKREVQTTRMWKIEHVRRQLAGGR